MDIKIKIDKYWLLKRALFYITLFFAILLNYYLLDGNWLSLFWIGFVFYLIKDKVPPSPKEWGKLLKSIKITKD
jgi:hypothetical protein